MTDRRGDEPWTWIGFRFGLGFWTAGVLFSAFGALLTWFILTQDFSTARRRAQAAELSIERALRRPPPAVPEAPATVEVPPRSVEACKALTGGQINEDFARCRRGFTETR